MWRKYWWATGFLSTHRGSVASTRFRLVFFLRVFSSNLFSPLCRPSSSQEPTMNPLQNKLFVRVALSPPCSSPPWIPRGASTCSFCWNQHVLLLDPWRADATRRGITSARADAGTSMCFCWNHRGIGAVTGGITKKRAGCWNWRSLLLEPVRTDAATRAPRRRCDDDRRGDRRQYMSCNRRQNCWDWQHKKLEPASRFAAAPRLGLMWPAQGAGTASWICWNRHLGMLEPCDGRRRLL